MITQTDQFNEHAHAEELANRDQIEAAEPVDTAFLATLSIALGFGCIILALIVALSQGWIKW